MFKDRRAANTALTTLELKIRKYCAVGLMFGLPAFLIMIYMIGR